MASPLTIRFQEVLAGIGERSARQLHHVWEGLGDYHDAQIPDFERHARPILTAAKTVAVQHAVAYYAIAAGVAPVAVRVADVPVEPNYREPFISTWLALKNGASLTDAIEAGAARTDAVARDLVTSSARQTGDAVVTAAGLHVIGWQRIPDADACPWCLLVAGQLYTTAETADFGHDRCGCTAEPVFDAA